MLLLSISSMLGMTPVSTCGQHADTYRNHNFGNTTGCCGASGDLLMNPPNVLFVLWDDISADRFPEWGNAALRGKLPGIEQLKADGAITYKNFYTQSSLCGQAQAALNFATTPSAIGAQHFAHGGAYAVPPDDVISMTEMFRKHNYWTVGVGKLDFQVSGAALNTFLDKQAGGSRADATDPQYVKEWWDPALEDERPFFTFANMMDQHEASIDGDHDGISVSDPETGLYFNSELGFVTDTLQGSGYSLPHSESFKYSDGNEIIIADWSTLDQQKYECTEYLASFDENTINRADGSLPAAFPDNMHSRCFLAREYDCVRNSDWRLTRLIDVMKSKGIYDNTMIVVAGDHGTGLSAAGKHYMRRESVHSPMWIKYPKGFDAPNVGGVDEAIVNMYDIYPTMLSVTGIVKSKPEWMIGEAFAGPWLKNNKFSFNEIGIAGSGTDGAQKVVTIVSDMYTYQRCFHCRSHASRIDEINQPITQNTMKLAKEGRLEPELKIFVSDSPPPSESLWLHGTDPGNLDNLLYRPIITETGAGDAYNLTIVWEERPIDATLTSVRDQMRSVLASFVAVSPEFGEARDMTPEEIKQEQLAMDARFLGADGNPRVTAAPTMLPPGGTPVPSGVRMDVTVKSGTPGALTELAVVDAETTDAIFPLGLPSRFNSLVDPGFEVTQYTTADFGLNRTGFLWSDPEGRPVEFSAFWGKTSYNGVDVPRIFISDDLTYMEVGWARNDGLASLSHAYDSRDFTWDGTQHVNVDAEGNWIDYDTRLKLINDDGTPNLDIFQPYVFGPHRREHYRGDPHPEGLRTLSKTFAGREPPPFYWAFPGEDPNIWANVRPFSPFAQLTSRTYELTKIAIATEGIETGRIEITQFVSGSNGGMSPTVTTFFPYDLTNVQFKLDTSATVSTGQSVIARSSRKGYTDSSPSIAAYP